ncbi:MAG: LuxR C-terminal-related transcriptional regulator [Gammaproteobacteria bacterium]
MPQYIYTKLHPPIRHSGLLARRRLMQLISGCRDYTLTVVRAPAGYGKTTALAQWHNATLEGGNLIGWLSLDAEDNDAHRFYAHLVAAVRPVCEDFGNTILGQLDTGVQVHAETIAVAIINEFALLKTPAFLVLDDYHYLSNSEIIKAIAYVAESAPLNLHLLLAGRTTPPLPLARLRARRQLLEIDASDLRFMEDETSSFFRLTGNSLITPSHAAELGQRTEGWVAGLQLAEISLQNRQDVDVFMQSFSGKHRDIADFLAEDVLLRQPHEVRNFLLKTSVLERLHPGLCNAVTASGNAREMLDRIDRAGLFLFALDDERIWYRYHHLFSEFLRKCLSEQEPMACARLHLLASRWFEKYGFIDEAIKHAIDAGDMECAAALLDASCDNMFYNGQFSRLVGWTGRIPAACLAKYPRILLNQAWKSTLEWQFSRARRLLDLVATEIARRTGMDGPANDDPLPSVLMHREMMFAQCADDMPAVECQCHALMQHFPVDDAYLQGNLYSSLIVAQRNLYKLKDINRLDARACEFYQAAGSRFVLVWHGAVMGPTHYLRGDLGAAETSLCLALDIAIEIGGPDSGLAAMPALLLAEIHYEQNQLQQAASLIDRYLPLARQIGFVDQLIAGYICRARLALEEGVRQEAQRVLEEADRFAEQSGFVRLVDHVRAERLRILATGRCENMKTLFSEPFRRQDETALSPEGVVTTGDAIRAIGHIRYACIKGEIQAALHLSRQWMRFTGKRGAVRDQIRFSLLLARAQQLAGDSKAAYRSVRDSLTLAQPRGLRRSFIDEGKPIIAILREIAEQSHVISDPAVHLAAELATLAGNPPDRSRQTRDEVRITPAFGPLNRRQVQILERVSAGLRNREIAEDLGLTEGSVKWHMQQIFNKLDTRRRSVAVERGRNLGLLP